MWVHDYFSKEEFDQRLQAVRNEMAKRDLEVCLVSSPENRLIAHYPDPESRF